MKREMFIEGQVESNIRFFSGKKHNCGYELEEILSILQKNEEIINKRDDKAREENW